ncbi:hypothetical protein I302_106264 [Kwoniella bestiolae CBS 10118]|uniref:Uncharacterized protein n=1 Tax=Kwoniella bestiolae CBS 10118 TaxID=1296100 RepID=A0A1B9G3K2_9TREE|nr:hypothetical protein I302_05388 [Kwoniella bestiolae CBS 10118]OCF25568.1 hypothetical protein I302_05388 [Kwoniella bestiolae CBS 10118]
MNTYTPDTASSYGTPSPSSSYRRFSDESPSPLPQYALSSDLCHLVEEPGMNVVIARKVAKLQDSLPNLSPENLRQAKADMMYLLTILDGEGGEVAQCKAGAVFSAPV